MNTRHALAIFAKLAIVMTGCSLQTADEQPVTEDDQGQAQLAIDTAESNVAETEVLLTVSEPAAKWVVGNPGTTDELTAKAASLNKTCPGGGSVSSAQQDNTVTFSFDSCAGLYGMSEINGQATATYTVKLTGLNVQLEAAEITINSMTLSLNSLAVISETSTGALEVAIDSAGSAEGPLGNTVDYEGESVVVIDESSECISLDGSWTVYGSRNQLAVAASEYQRCPSLCPQDGSELEVTWQGRKQRGVSIGFDGSDTASFQTDSGHTGSIPLGYCASN